jgi:hypothetical protein
LERALDMGSRAHRRGAESAERGREDSLPQRRGDAEGGGRDFTAEAQRAQRKAREGIRTEKAFRNERL